MIIAIADDITGAAEIGGIGWRQGLRVCLSDQVRASDADLLVIYTNTRSLNEAEAKSVMQRSAEEAARLQPDWIYKKTDSVLRGHIAAELLAMLPVTGEKQVLLIPVNPFAGRVIRKGQYLVHGQPLDQTGFATDPEYPAQTSNVLALLGTHEARLIGLDEEWAASSILVGEAEQVMDLGLWAQRASGFRFLAGGGPFFEALLRQRALVDHPFAGEGSLQRPLLFVSGTKFGPSRERLLQQSPLFLIPFEHQVREEMITAIREKGMAFLGFAEEVQGTPGDLRSLMAEETGSLHACADISELIIEGGSTAYAIVQRLGLHSFTPVFEWSPGVVRLRSAERPSFCLTIKPGSYPWPDNLIL